MNPTLCIRESKLNLEPIDNMENNEKTFKTHLFINYYVKYGKKKLQTI